MVKQRNRETGNCNEKVSIVVTRVAVLLRTAGRAVPAITRVSFFLSLFIAAPVIAQETSLIDILKAKGVLSQEDVNKLRAGSGKGTIYGAFTYAVRSASPYLKAEPVRLLPHKT